jgi:hypothetical protein
VVEIKCLDRLQPIHSAQLLTYLKLLPARRGLLINFNVPRLVDGVRSMVLSRQSRESAQDRPAKHVLGQGRLQVGPFHQPQQRMTKSDGADATRRLGRLPKLNRGA